MKRVNFKELEIEETFDDFVKVDVRKQIGNLIHRESSTIPMSDLARKIYYSEGEIEISEEDFVEMLKLLSALRVKRIVIDAISKCNENNIQ